MNETFTLRRFYFRVGLCSSVFWAAVVMVFLTMIFWDDEMFPPDKKAAGIFLISLSLIVPICFLGMSLWVLLAYYRESITIDNDIVHFTGVIYDRTLSPDRTRAIWRFDRRLSLKFISPRGNVTIYFENFRGEQQRRLIHFLRRWISLDMQKGWTEEIERYAAAIEFEDSPAERDRQFRENMKCIWRATAIASPVVVMVFVGFFVWVYWYVDANSLAEYPSWSGSPIVDFALICSVACPGIAFMGTIAYWLEVWTSRQ